ncbi:MAG: hypothetical protein RRY78_03000 [Clostridia bacterium]
MDNTNNNHLNDNTQNNDNNNQNLEKQCLFDLKKFQKIDTKFLMIIVPLILISAVFGYVHAKFWSNPLHYVFAMLACITFIVEYAYKLILLKRCNCNICRDKINNCIAVIVALSVVILALIGLTIWQSVILARV